ncbi:MAG: hypothetical protein KHW93_07285 [Butyricicoccus pullicaecorum]|nr:hypothetical protein [Butyricicoccus pullicaecorum]
MPRLTKRRSSEWAFFIHPQTGRRTYNKFCRGCIHDCKQSFRAVVVSCPHYRSKRANKHTGKP